MDTRLPPAVRSDRLELRPFVSSDRPAYDAYHSRPEVYRFLYAPVPGKHALSEQFAACLQPRFENNGDALHLAVIRREDSALLGEVLLKMASKDALQAEIGYIFNPDFSGAGYATEAVRMMLDIGFSEYGFHRIFARLDPLNKGSVGVVERLRFRREAHLLQNDRFNGVWGDEFIYALLQSEWEKRALSASS
ncbi:Protein N-acetyltransferase, RimJ/RimL family [Nitratireductor aquibiodomus]|uniref:Protein N-acetyltransferase, RimJ/RimL family n=1 Tax=Nitratireductor aquibiodomus TaxID=204799 RepID=A0A1H4IXC6_9HYPH|nr:GNAT family protein [Nitratireductor aquibiodomus]SEB38637.1 Protein N-acetyltransferase, RimJ/RimL family [Nitratireductor aquibiodomus]